MPITSPITETARGFHTFVRGFRWLKQHPKYMAVLFTPMLIGFLGMIMGMQVFMEYDETILSYVLWAEPADNWFMYLVYKLAYVLLYIAAVGMTLVGALLLTNIIASPFYEVVSCAIEREMTGKAGDDLGFWQNIKVMMVEIKKVTLILFANLIVFFIPMVNVIGIIIAAFLVGWDFFDYPVARRDWTLRRRIGFVMQNFWSVMGFGVWLVIPVANFILMPLAVAGGTILNLEALEKSASFNVNTPGSTKEKVE